MPKYIGMFTGSCPGGWSNFSALNGNYLKVATSYGGTGGGTSHTHAATLPTTSLTASPNQQGRHEGVPAVKNSAGNHTHTVSFASVNTGSGTLEPRHTTVVFCSITE